MNRSNLFLYFFIFFIVGVFCISFFSVATGIFLEILFISAAFLVISFVLKDRDKKRKTLIFSLCLIFLALGILRGAFAGLPKESETLAKEDESFVFGNFRDKLKEKVSERFSPPYSYIVGALALGDKKAIDKTWRNKFARAGLLHLLCISGTHIIILAMIFFKMGEVLKIRRGKAIAITLFFIWFFIFFTGAQNSAVRAGIMGSLYFLAMSFGRPGASFRPLVLAAGVMLAASPALLRYSPGFQLSFFAVAGIIVLCPVFNKLFKKLKRAGFLLSLTFSAQIFVAPLLFYYFGEISLIAPLTNILIVPFLPVVMILSFLFVILAALSWVGGTLASFLLLPFLFYIVKVVNLFSAWKISVLFVNFSSVAFVLLLATLFIASFFIIYRRQRPFKLSSN